MHVSILYGPIQVLSGIVILKKYFGSVGIQIFSILLKENVLILLFKRIQDIGWKSWKKPGKSLEFCFKKSVGTLEGR